MYKQALDTLIAQNSLPSSIMLYGECRYQRELYINKLASMFGKKEEQLKFYFDEYDFKSAHTFVSQSSLFGGSNILIIKTDKTIPKKELETIIKSCQKNQNSYFLLEYTGEDKRAKEIAKNFSKKFSADFVRFFKPYRNEAISILSQIAKDIGIDIQRYAIEHLYDIQNEDIPLCVEELKKLSILDKSINTQDIDNHSFSLGLSSMQTLIERFFQKKDIKELIKEIEEVSHGNEVFFINSMQNYLATLFMFYTYILSYGRYDVKEILGYPLPPMIAKQKADMSIKLKLPTYKTLFIELSKIELKLKTDTHIDKSSFFISSLIKLQTFL